MADRRQVLLHSALISLGAGLVGAHPLQAASPYAFRPGPGPMLYRRKITRGLAGGGAITVERQFRIAFTQTEGGYEVTGEQTAVSVDAPPALKALADLEQKRIESGLFPIRLDQAGLIQAGPTVSASAATKEAVTKAMSMANGSETISDPALYRQFLNQVQQSAAQFMSHLPTDLFAPSTQPIISRRELPLPGDLLGEVEVVYKSAANPSTGLLTSARREVTTRIGADSRMAQEAWRLEPA